MTNRFIVPALAAALLALPAAALAQTAGGGSGSGRPTSKPGGHAQGSSVHARTLDQIERSTPQGFSVVLVLGDMSAASTAADNVPPAARKALTDMKDFLPYKSYRLLDVQWTLCCGRAPMVSRLRGADGLDYELNLNTSVDVRPPSELPSSAEARPRLSIRFHLTEPVMSERTSESNDLVGTLTRERQRLEQQHTNVRRKAQQRFQVGAGSNPDEDRDVMEARARLSEVDIRLAEARQLGRKPNGKTVHMTRSVIDASFRMDVGETVVVGTSRVQGGDKAIIALLTAVPQKASTTTTR